MPGETPVLILTGPPGAGKTTTASALAARSPRSVHLESDRFFQFVRSDYVEPWRPESSEQNRVVSFADVGELEANVLEPTDEDVEKMTETLARDLEDGRLLV